MKELIHPSMIYFVKKECDPSWRIDHQQISFYGMVFLLEGSADYIIDGVPYRLQQGDVLCVHPGSCRSATTSGMACVAIDFVLQPGEAVDLPVVTLWKDFTDMQWIMNEINYEWLQKNDGYAMKCQALLTLILHKLLYERRNRQTNVHVNAIKRYIVEHYQEELTVKAIARVVNLNPVYCGALFKKVEKRTISEFINRVRINKAAALLESGEYNVSEAAERTGFKDIYHFSSTFKQLMGISPRAYRNKAGSSPASYGP